MAMDAASRVDRAMACATTLRSARVHRLLGGARWSEGPWPDARRASVWTLSQVWHAELLLTLLGGGLDEAEQVDHDLRGYRGHLGWMPYPSDHLRYFDDNAWMGLALVQRHLRDGDPDALASAKDVFRILRQGEDDDGGVRWRDVADSPRNTCATAPAIELALRLHLIDPDGDALAFAERNQAWLDAVLRRDDHLYADNVDDDGRVEHSLWSYNQGTPVGAAALWYRVSGEARWIDRGAATLTAALAHFGREDGAGWWSQPPVFNAVFFRNASAFEAVAGLGSVAPVLDRYLDRVIADALDPATGWCSGGGIGHYDQGGTIDQAGLVQCFAVAALAARSPERLADLC